MIVAQIHTDIGIAPITHFTHMHNIRKKNKIIICKKEIPTNKIFCFFFIGATYKEINHFQNWGYPLRVAPIFETILGKIFKSLFLGGCGNNSVLVMPLPEIV